MMKSNLPKFFSASLTAVGAIGIGAAAFAISQTPGPAVLEISGVKTHTETHFTPLAEPASSNANPFTRTMGRNLRPDALKEAGADDINLIGSVCYADWMGAASNRGMYKIPKSPEADFEKIAVGPAASYGGAEVDGIYYACWYTSVFGSEIFVLESYYADSWEQAAPADKTISYTLLASDVSVDPVSGKVYGCFYNDQGNGFVFGYVDYPTRTRTAIRALEGGIQGAWNAVACDTDGSIYAIDMTGDLLSVDKETGATTRIGATGYVPRYMSSATIDPDSGRMFWTLSNDDTKGLIEIDKTTGAGTLMTNFSANEQVNGIYVSKQKFDDKAPKPVKNVSVDFPKNSMTGNILFTSPSTLFDGSEAMGEIDYTITVDGVEVAAGKTLYGQSNSVPVTVGSSGEKTFTVTVANSAGESPRRHATGYTGYYRPAAPENIQLSINDDDNMVVAWDPVVLDFTGDLISEGEVRYTVTRYPDGEVVAEGISETSVIDDFEPAPELTVHHYLVEATYFDAKSAPGKSPYFRSGRIYPPYLETFDTAESLLPFTVLDENNDDDPWYWDETHKCIVSKNSSRWRAIDDWAITPPIAMEANKQYKLSFDYKQRKDIYGPQTLEIKWGNAPTVDGMTVTIMPAREISNGEWETYETYITAPMDGTFYIGFHDISAADMDVLYIDNISISAPVSTSAPAAVGNLTATAAADGGLSATVEFTAPDKCVNGDELTAIEKIEIRRNGETVKTIETPEPASAQSFVDEVSASGIYTYEVVAFNAAGEGESVEKSVFIGVNRPAAVTGIEVSEDAAGNVTLTWPQIDKDADGLDINPALVRYDVFEYENGNATKIADGITENTLTYKAAEGDTQRMLRYSVVALTDGGRAFESFTSFIPVGKAYESFAESFAGGTPTYAWAMNFTGAAQWDVIGDNALGGVTSQDGDNGFLVMTAASPGIYDEVRSGKIKVPANDPALSLYFFYIDDKDVNRLEVDVTCEGETTQIGDITFSTAGGQVNHWVEIRLPLEEFAGKEITLSLKATAIACNMVLLDNISVKENSGVDINLYDGVRVIATADGISVSGAGNTEVTICSIDGIMIHKGRGDATVAAAKGIYTVTVGGKTFKIAK